MIVEMTRDHAIQVATKVSPTNSLLPVEDLVDILVALGLIKCVSPSSPPF